MEAEQNNIFIRLLDIISGITAVSAVVVVALVAGASAYHTYQPTSLQAQAINISAQDAPVTSTTESSACQQEIATAAARGYPDTESVITDQSSLQFEDQCVAAILNPGVTTLGPHNPGSYMCVGKSARLNVTIAGLITETAVPDAAVPAGTCAAVACTSYDASGQSSCIAANNLTSLNGSSIEDNLSAAQSSSLSPDSGISSFTLNSDGSIANESANTANVLDSGAGDQGLAGNSVSLDQSVSAQAAGAPSDVSSGPPGIGETQAVSGEPTQLPEIEVTPDQSAISADDAQAAAEPEAAPGSSPTGPEVTVPATNDVTPPEQIAGADQTLPSQLPGPNLNGPQPIVPTITDTEGDIGSLQSVSDTGASASGEATSPNIFEQFAGTVQNDTYSIVNDMRSWVGLEPLGGAAPPSLTPATVGIRG